MEDPLKLPDLPENKKVPPHEELFNPPTMEELKVDLNSVFEGIRMGLYKLEEYEDSGVKRGRVRDLSGKIIYDSDDYKNFSEDLAFWNWGKDKEGLSKTKGEA